MPDPQGRLRYAGVWCEGAFSVVRTRGVVPDQIRAEFLLRDSGLPPVGDIEVFYGSQRLLIPACRLLQQEIIQSGGGRVRMCTFLDTRWAWRSALAFGNFNIRTNYTDLEVLRILMDSMGIPFTVSNRILARSIQIPFIWFNGMNFEDGLNSFLTQSEFTFCYQWDGSAVITNDGDGPPPPSDSRVMDFEVTTIQPPIPEWVGYAAAPTKFEVDIPLEAVGYELNTNNTPNLQRIKPLHQLSYRPPAGQAWDWPNFNNVTSFAARELCRKTIFRLYRMHKNWGDLQVPIPTFGAGPKAKLSQWVRPADYKVDSAGALGTPDDYYRIDCTFFNEPPAVFGYWWDGGILCNNNVPNILMPNAYTDVDEFHFSNKENWEIETDSTLAPLKNQKNFTFDAKQQLFVFDEPKLLVPRNNTGIINSARYAAWMVARTNFALQRRNDRELLRPVIFLRTNAGGSVPGYVHMIADEKSDYPGAVVTPRNQTSITDLTSAAYGAASAYMFSLLVKNSATIPMKGFCFDQNISGTIAGVRFDRAPDGRCTTTVEWNKEDPMFGPTMTEKQMFSQIKIAEKNMLSNLQRLANLYQKIP